jgi:hypothetical protein
MISIHKLKNPYLRTMRIFFVILFCAAEITLLAQPVNLQNSFKGVFDEKPKATAKWDTWGTFIGGRTFNTQALKVGAEFNEILVLGVGYNWLSNGVYKNVNVQGVNNLSEFELRYFGPYAELDFFKSGHWKGTLPIQLGFGKSFLKYNDAEGNRIKLNEGRVILYEPAMSFSYDIANLFEVGAGFGYRIMLENNKSIDQPLTSPNFVLRLSLNPYGWAELFHLDEMGKKLIESN